MNENGHNKTKMLRSHMRDLLGFVRMENAVLMDQGHLTLRGLYLQKMMRLKDLEDRAQALAQEKSDEDIAECLVLLRNVQKELKINTVYHMDALKHKSMRFDGRDGEEDISYALEGGNA